jgi:hypothetical protein
VPLLPVPSLPVLLAPVPSVPLAPVPLGVPKVHFPPVVHEQVSPVQAQSPVHVAPRSVLEPHATTDALADKPAIPKDRTMPSVRMLSFSCAFRGEETLGLCEA